jgi:hypothetical protein
MGRRRWIVLVTILLSLAIPALHIRQRLRERTDEDRRRIEADGERRVESVRRALPAFFTDRVRLAGHPLFSPASNVSADAGPLLNGLVRWTPSQAIEPAPACVRAVAAFVRSQPNRETGRLGELPPREHFAVEDPPFELPEPEFFDLLDWAKLRLMVALRDGDVAAGFAEVTQLARLLTTTESVRALYAATALLVDVEVVRRFLADRAPPPVLDDETKRAARSHFLAIEGLLIPQVGDDVLDRVLDENAPGVCAALAVGAQAPRALRYGLEMRHPDFYARLDRRMASTGRCRLTSARRLWSRRGDRALFESMTTPEDRADLLYRIGIRYAGIAANLGDRLALVQLQFFEKHYVND